VRFSLKSWESRSDMSTDTNADMSYQNDLSYKLKEFFDSLKVNGVKRTLRKIFRRIWYFLKGVDFSTQNLHDLSIVGNHANNGTALVSTSRDFLCELFTVLRSLANEDFQKERFVDFGSGKAAAIIHARSLGFKRSLGAEFAKELHKIAEKNIEKMGVDEVISLNIDAAEFIPPKDTTLIFMFNPFDETVMKKAIENILKAKKSFLYPCFLIYVNPTVFYLLEDSFELIGKKEFKSGAKVRFYRV